MYTPRRYNNIIADNITEYTSDPDVTMNIIITITMDVARKRHRYKSSDHEILDLYALV
jgi:hypothetical protein